MTNLIRILIRPREVYEDMKEDPRSGLPLFTMFLIGLFCCVIPIVMWGQEGLTAIHLEQAAALEQSGAPSEEVEAARIKAAKPDAYFGSFFDTLFLLITMICVGVLLLATYLWIFAKFSKVQIGWRAWFAFSCWSQLPLTIGWVVKAFGMGVTTSTQVHWLSPLVWIGLDHLFAKSITLPVIWSTWILGEGLRSWTLRSREFSYTMAVFAGVFLTLAYGTFEAVMESHGLD